MLGRDGSSGAGGRAEGRGSGLQGLQGLRLDGRLRFSAWPQSGSRGLQPALLRGGLAPHFGLFLQQPLIEHLLDTKPWGSSGGSGRT